MITSKLALRELGRHVRKSDHVNSLPNACKEIEMSQKYSTLSECVLPERQPMSSSTEQSSAKSFAEPPTS